MTMRVAIYARYSSDNQRDASIADQVRLCRLFASQERWAVEEEYADHAVSGATLLRPGFQALMRDALRKRFDVVLTESLDRLSRDQEDTAGLFKRLTFVGVRVVTLAEGEISHLHVGLKGTMNALFLKDLADKTRRGLRGRVEQGKSAGGLCYGYRVTHTVRNGTLSTGEREVDHDQALIVQRVFGDYAAGISPKEIAKRLNREGVQGPAGAAWSPSTIHGNAARGTGILNNELYVGRLIWNRQHFVKDPDTGRRVARMNPKSEWTSTDVPDLRVIGEDLWQAVKSRQASVRRVRAAEASTTFSTFRRPKYIFSGLTKCGECGGGYIMYWRERLACFNARSRGTCTNRLTIGRREVEERVLRALREKLMRKDLFEEFCREYTRELNRLRMAQRGGLSRARHELARVERELRQLVQAIKDGLPPHTIKNEFVSLEAQREDLERQVQAPEPQPLLHPNMADVYRDKVTSLCVALEQGDRVRTEAHEAIRGLIEAIELKPDGSTLGITLKGNLAGMLTLAQNKKRPSETDDLLDQVQLVAGAGFEPATFGL
jgi:site-specific DNA recombinase